MARYLSGVKQVVRIKSSFYSLEKLDGSDSEFVDEVLLFSQSDTMLTRCCRFNGEESRMKFGSRGDIDRRGWRE